MAIRYIVSFAWLWACCVSACADTIYFIVRYLLTMSWDPRIEGCQFPIYMIQILVQGRRDLVAAMSKYIKKRLYGGVGKIGWGYYKDLPKGVTPDDHSFSHKLELMPLAGGATVVDLGCGHGWFASRLAARFPKATVYG